MIVNAPKTDLFITLESCANSAQWTVNSFWVNENMKV